MVTLVLSAKTTGIREIIYGYVVNTSKAHGKAALGCGVPHTGVGERHNFTVAGTERTINVPLVSRAKPTGIREITYGYVVSTGKSRGKTALGCGVSRTGVGEGLDFPVTGTGGTIIRIVLEAKSMGMMEITYRHG